MSRATTRERRLRVLAVCMAVALAGSGCTPETQPPAPDIAAVDSWAAATSALAGELPQAAGPYTKPIRTAQGIQPPTNSWISGAIFNDVPQPVFSGVLAFQPSDNGFGVGLPAPHPTPKTIFGSYTPDLMLGLSADHFELSRLDSLSATFSYFKGSQEIGRLTAAQGWPYLSYQALEQQDVSVPVSFEGTDTDHTAVVAETSYHLVGENISSDSAGTRAALGAGSVLTLYAEPQDADAATLDAMRQGAVPLRGTTTTYDVTEGTVSTTYALDTADRPTVFAAMPHQSVADGETLKGSYPSINGQLSLHTGMIFSFDVAERAARSELDLTGLAPAEREELAGHVIREASEVQFLAPDSYYGGKALYRAVNIYLLAEQLQLSAQASDLKDLILAELDRWLSPTGCSGDATKCFTYDTTLGGVVGQAPAYGSDEFNDHHFHYGYFLYAVGAMALADSALVERYRTMTDLLAMDIASPESTDAFPQRRAFDDYAGHSWASGTSPFADGNNQESSSEAVNAWAGLSLWAQASTNQSLATEATWMLSLESQTALDYWVYPAAFPDFDAPLVGMVWGGKRDFATFFDPSPAAILGIQLIPFGPTMDYLMGPPEKIIALVDQSAPAGKTDLPLIDYNLMFLGMADRDTALERARDLPDKNIDNGNSRSYLLASIMARR